MFSNSIIVNKTCNVKTCDDEKKHQLDTVFSKEHETPTKPSKHVTFDKNVTEMTTTTTHIKNKKLCLNMIVKNESGVIERLLQSVAPYIDCYCICDTGSTDDTTEKIETFFKKRQIPGIIVKEPFKDFGYNRTFALKACDALDVKFILLMDADMILQVSSKFTIKEQLYKRLEQNNEDVFLIFQGSDTFFYKNARIAKNHKGYTYWGVTHEYLNTGEHAKYGTIQKDELFIIDVGDGGCKTNKFLRDIQLLENGLREEPNNVRYTFYLANSYKDVGQHDKAIELYKKRVSLGGWFEEIWFSLYNIGNSYKDKNDMANAIYWWLEAFNLFPKRAENLYHIIQHYRCNNKHILAYEFYIIARNIIENNKNMHDYLFYQKDVHDYKIDYELTIIGHYYNRMNYDLCHTCMKVINYPHIEEHLMKNVFCNYKFYAKPLTEKISQSFSIKNRKLLIDIGKTIPELQNENNVFKGSTPSVCLINNKTLVVNVRFVNYFIDENGNYNNREHITTINVIATIDITNADNWKKTNEFVLQYDKKHDNLYVGLEDIRLFHKNEKHKVWFNANRGLENHTMKVEHGIIDFESHRTIDTKLLTAENHPQNNIEKNWVLFENGKTQLKVIYGWSPLTIGHISNTGDTFKKTDEIKTPYFFKHLRGSTNGVKIGDEVWFICHTVSYEERRYYYHIFVVLDANSYQVKRHTSFFTFEKEKVEYTLGFVHLTPSQTTANKEQFMIGYSVMDKTTNYMFIDKETVEEMMFSL